MSLVNYIKESADKEYERILRENYINETFVNLHTKVEMKKYADAVWGLFQKTYKDLGGFKGAKNANHMISKAGFMKLVRKNGKIIAAAVYKDKHGRKAIGGAHDMTPVGKQWAKQIYKDDIKFNRAWGEFSGAAEKYALHKGMKPVPAHKVEKIIGKKIKPSKDGYHYTREIGGTEYEKILLAPPESKLHK